MTSSVVALQTDLAKPCPAMLNLAAVIRSLRLWLDIFFSIRLVLATQRVNTNWGWSQPRSRSVDCAKSTPRKSPLYYSAAGNITQFSTAHITATTKMTNQRNPATNKTFIKVTTTMLHFSMYLHPYWFI